ncbi:MAG: hypothetical protein PUI52_02650 [Bacteroidales bacterium]|nr:hypothetical protein [Bacteroidales bacterium]MDY6170772.1 hypothetical protein [Candidatus Cryptobacteroides sp.]
MKFNINKLLAVLVVASLGVACNKEQLQDEIPSSGNGTVQVVVSIDNGTRSFSDAEGVKWEVGDQIKYAGGVELTSKPLTDEQITDNGYKASFTFDASLIQADRTGWFCSTKCHPTNYTEVEFTLGKDNGNLFTQAEAGQMNSRYLFLHSGTGLIKITKDVVPEVKMEIAGSIFRVIPYTTKYNDEKILSVKLSSKTNLVGTVSYDRGGKTKTYTGVTELNGGNGWKSYNFVKANLDTPFSLEGITSAQTSKGIYFAVAATPAGKPLDGYKYEVKTDKAKYVFDAMTDTLAVRNNFVKNVYLNLDKATSRVEGETGLLKYDGALTLTTIPAAGASNRDAGYWEAYTSTDEGSSWTKRINAENAPFYSSVKFSYADAATGEPVEWISVVYGGNDLCHWMVTAKENTGEERSVKVTATYSDVKGYVIQEEKYKTKELIIKQAAAGSNKKLTFFGGIGDTTIDAVKVENKDLGFCAIDVDGEHAEDWNGNSHNEAELYGSVTITPYVDGTGVGANATVADWLTVGYGKDSEGKLNSTHIFVTAQDNTGAERKSLVYCVYKAPEGYEFEGGQKEVYKQFFVTQKSGLTVEAAFTGFPTEAVAAAGTTVSGKLNLTINGKNQTDVTTAISTYGLSLSVNKGATATVDASGNVEVVIPENKYKNGGVEYTLSLKKSDDTVAASFVITQKEGTEEVTTVKYTYTLTKNNGVASGAIWGMNVNAKNGADFTITDVKLNDQPVTLDEVSAAAVLAQAIKCLPEKPAAGYDGYTVIDNGQIYINVVNFSGSTLNAGVATTDSSNSYITKLVWYDSDGTEAGNWFIFVP